MRFALAAALLLLATPALAQERHHDGGPGIRFGADQNGFDFRLHDPREFHGRDPREFHGRFVGVGRHFWRGQWWDYGVGDCWAVGPDGRWWWICD